MGSGRAAEAESFTRESTDLYQGPSCPGACIPRPSPDLWLHEVGGGLNFKRPKFLGLVDAIIAGNVQTLLIAHKDRLVQFGYDLMVHICQQHCEPMVLNHEPLSPEQEMVQDLLTIFDCFSTSFHCTHKWILRK